MNRGVAATQATPQKLRMHIPAMEVISIKQIYDYIIWAAVLMAILFFLLNITCLRNGLHKILYWRVYAIRYLTRKTSIES